MAPKLSIILTSRNKYELLKFAVDSVIRQTFGDWELIVVDDASEDPRIGEYLRLLADVPRVRVMLGKPVNDEYRRTHKMVAVRINAAMEMSEGKYISYLGDDNVYLPRRCERMVKVLDKNKGVGMVVDRVRWVMFDGQEADQDKFKYGYREPHEPGHEVLLEMISPSNYICTDSVMHRRQRPCCMNWPTDLRSHTPVDWRYWCYLVDEMGIKIKKLDVIGERAYFPGTWRHGVTVKQVLSTRREPLREEDDMSGKTRLKARRKREAREARKRKAKDKKGKIWCVNTSGKRQQITIPGGGAPKKVEPDGRIELKFVKTSNGLMDGFSYDTRATTPPLKQVLNSKPAPPKNVEYERVDEEDMRTEPAPEEPPPPKPKKPIPAPRPKKKIAKSAPAAAKSPVDEPPEEKPDDGVRRCACGKEISARNKSGKCRDCYIASLKKKE